MSYCSYSEQLFNVSCIDLCPFAAGNTTGFGLHADKMIEYSF